MVGIFPQAQQSVGGLFERINQAAQTPSFGLGIGLLSGSPQAGFQNAQQAALLQNRQAQQAQAQAAAQQKAQADAAQRAFQNDLSLRADQRAQGQFDRGPAAPAIVQQAKFLFPNDPAKQQRFVQANSVAEQNKLNRQADERKAQIKAEAEAIPDFKDVTSLRKEFTDVSADFQEIGRNLNTINTLGANTDAASHLGLIVAFTKLLDPGSVAREGEVKLTQSAQGVVSKLGNLKNRLEKGETALPPEVVDDLLNAANELGANYSKSFKTRQGEFTKIADTFFPGLDPAMILVGANDPTVAQPDATGGGAGGNGAPPPGVTSEEWNEMTPAEKALFDG